VSAAKLAVDDPGIKSAMEGSRDRKLLRLSMEFNRLELIPATPGNIVPADGSPLRRLLLEILR
jgi:hypothetical protein